MSQQQKAPVDINATFCYLVAPDPLRLAACDGKSRKTAKCKLFDAALSSMEADIVDLERNGAKFSRSATSQYRKNTGHF